MTTTRAAALAGLLFLGLGAAAPATAAEEDHSRHADHSAHAMSAEDLATLRRKIPLYQQYTDDQINQSMARMADLEIYVSPEGVRDEVGILALGHGYKEPGNTFFRDAYAPMGRRHPVAAGLGMAMMSSDHIQSAVDRLERAGAKTIVAIPTEIGDDTSLIRQWHYIFGLTDESAYLDVPRVQSRAKIVMTKTPTTSPLTGEILADFAKSAVKDPARDVVLLVVHGPEEAEDNAKLLKILQGHAARVQAVTGVREVKYDSLQDDAPTEIRKANVDRMRAWIRGHADQGHRVIVVQALITGQGGVTGRLRRDFEGLQYELVDKGLAEHPLFNTWVEETVKQALASP